MAQNQRATQKAIQLLPKHRDLIEKIKMYGLAAV